MDISNETPQEQKVNFIVSEAANQTKAKEDAIKNLQSDKVPQPGFSGSGFITGQPLGNKNLAEAQLKKDIGGIREGALNDTAKAIEGAPVKTQAKAYKTADDFAYPETARQNDPLLKQGERKQMDETQRSAMHQMGNTAMKERGAKQKDISESQDYAMRKLGDEKEKGNNPPPQSGSGSSKQAISPQPFSSLLGYSKLNKSEVEPPEGKDAKQPMAMSGKFLLR